mgnify:CR=1 FL=1
MPPTQSAYEQLGLVPTDGRRVAVARQVWPEPPSLVCARETARLASFRMMDGACLCLLRHGQSQWNLENRFTGWADVPLTDAGRREAREAAKRIADQGIRFDVAFASVLGRCVESVQIVLHALDSGSIPVHLDMALNERKYGDLEGLDKAETAAKFGDEQVQIWRRSYDGRPPHGESLKDTQERVLPYFSSEIEPVLREGKNVLVIAHGNSLRALVMVVEGLTAAQIQNVEVPTGVPLIYRFDGPLHIVEKRELTGAIE